MVVHVDPFDLLLQLLKLYPRHIVTPLPIVHLGSVPGCIPPRVPTVTLGDGFPLRGWLWMNIIHEPCRVSILIEFIYRENPHITCRNSKSLWQGQERIDGPTIR
jgi:hypothetical protein